MQKIKAVSDADVQGKRVLLRLDFDVPLHEGKVMDDTRLRAALPTLELLHRNGASKILVLAHAGRPKGKDPALSLVPIAKRLHELSEAPFEFEENLRFDPREEANDESFAKELAAKGDIYVNDAFADSHRAHASIVGVPKFLPSYAGIHFLSEVENLSVALTPPKGALAIVGGAKFETKEPLIGTLLALYSSVLLGGALGNDVIKARGLPFGASAVSDIPVPLPLATSTELYVAEDAVVREEGANAEREALVVDIRAVEKIVDIGTKTREAWAQKIKNAPFVLWNGPMGMYEDGYVGGTDALAEALGASGTRAVVGGGDTVASLSKHTFDPQKVFISSGGGAMLQFLSDGTLPALEALTAS